MTDFIFGQIESSKIQKESNLSNKNYDKKETEKQLSLYQKDLNKLLEQKKYALKELSNAKKGIEALDGIDGVIKVSAGNYGGNLGKYKLYLKEILE